MMPSLLQRLKERKIVQWAVVYLAGAWLFLEALGFVADNFGWPSYITRSAIVLVAVGFFAALVLAWYHGEKGRQRASGVELLILAGILVIAGALVAMLGHGVQQRSAGEHEARQGTLEEMSIAVLPLVNRSGLQEDEYFTDGIHDEILTRLTKISALSVRGRTSVMQYRDSPKNLREIGQELNARYLLEGGVQRAGGTVRINLQLVDATRDEHLWAETYDQQLTVDNLLEVQSEVALRVAEALNAALTAGEAERIGARPTENLEAYDNYLRGRYFWRRRSLAAFDSAIEYYNRAVLLDPGYARAYAGLAETYALLPEYGGPPISEILPIAKAATERALTLGPDQAEAYAASAYIKSMFEWDREGAERDYLKAIELNPDYATAHQWYAELLQITRRRDEALVQARRAVELDPQSVMPNTVLAVALVCAGRPAEAVPAAQRALEIVPDQTLAIKWLAYAYVLNGEPAAAAPLFERFAELTGSDPAAYRAYLAALSDPAKMPAAVTALKAPGLMVHGLEAGGSVFLAHLGQYDEAMAVLEQCYEARWPLLPFVNTHPMLEQMRSDPRFRDLLRRMNFRE